MTAIEHPFDFMSCGIRLAGTLALPATTVHIRPRCCSAAQVPSTATRTPPRCDSTSRKPSPPAWLSHGIASLRYDKRGVGESGGDYLSAGFDDETADARAALDVVARPSRHRRRPGDRRRPLRRRHGGDAARDDRRRRPPATCCSAGPRPPASRSWSGRRVGSRRRCRRPRRVRARRLRAPPGATPSAAVGVDHRHRSPRVGPTGTRAGSGSTWPTTRRRRSTAIDGSVLAITGAKDIQVDPDDVARIGRIVTGRFDGEVPTDLTHILRRDPGPPSLRAYRTQFRRPVDPWVVDRIADWSRSLLG